MSEGEGWNNKLAEKGDQMMFLVSTRVRFKNMFLI